jgi:hypothetical protein
MNRAVGAEFVFPLDFSQGVALGWYELTPLGVPWDELCEPFLPHSVVVMGNSVSRPIQPDIGWTTHVGHQK